MTHNDTHKGRLPERLRNPMVIGACAAMVVSTAVYFAFPLFSLPVLGFDYGWDFIKAFLQAGKTMEAIPYLMPLIGSLAACVCLPTRGTGPHFLAVAFSALPVMFFSYFVYMLSIYPAAYAAGGNTTISMTQFINWSVWTSLALSAVAFALTLILLRRELKNQKQTK